MLNDLATTPIAETLRRLSAERRSGDLQVRSAKIVKTVFLDHGRVVFAASNLRKDRLGESLVAIGRITEADFQKATSIMGETKRRFGEALVEAGILERSEVGRLVARQVKRTVLSLFELPQGVASFEERRCPIPLEYMVSLSLHRMLYVGIKSMSDERLVLAGLGDLDRWVTLAEVPPFRFGIRKCSAEEKEILEHAKRKVTIRRLAWGQGGLTPSRLRAVYALLASGVLQDSERPEMVEQPVVQMETSTFLLSALQRRPDPTAGDAIRQEVDEELRRSANLDREKWLRVSRSAPRDQLARALEEKMERYHALLEAVGDDETLRTDIELILGRAASMLRLARQTAAPPAPSRPSPPAKPVAPAAAAVAPAPAAPPPQPPRPATTAPEPPAAEGAAEQPASAAPPAEEPPLAIEEIAIGEAPAAPELPGGEAPFSATEPRIAGDVERLLVEGSVKMTVGDYANAVRTYVKLCELEPNVAGYRVRLAVAMACYPRTAKSAERQFLEAIRLDPNNADIHFQFGIYYKAMKVRSRAVAELRTAVSLNPRHKQARAELEALAPKDSALTSLKKLFR